MVHDSAINLFLCKENTLFLEGSFELLVNIFIYYPELKVVSTTDVVMTTEGPTQGVTEEVEEEEEEDMDDTDIVSHLNIFLLIYFAHLYIFDYFEEIKK